MAPQFMIPLDGSQFAEQAIPYLLELATHSRATLHIVKVHRAKHDLEEDRRYLARIADASALAAFNPVTALIHGDVAQALHQYIRAAGIDLVVMSTHGRGGLSRAWYGSVADELLHVANVPVLLLRPNGRSSDAGHDDTFRNVLLPVDGSELSDSIVPAAASIGTVDTRYTLIRVIPPVPAIAYADGMTLVDSDSAREVRSNAIEHIEQLAAALRERGCRAESVVLNGPDIAATIRTYATDHDIDLIAMATHGRAGWKRLALGSVADRLIQRVPVPLLVLNPCAPDPFKLDEQDLCVLA